MDSGRERNLNMASHTVSFRHMAEGTPADYQLLDDYARRYAAGADDELVVGALLHDIGDDLAPYNHAAFAAAILRPYVRNEVTWVIAQHGLFQTYYYAHHLGGDRHRRDQFKDHPWYSACVRFCEWDQASFDHFEPLLRRIFLKTVHDHSAQG